MKVKSIEVKTASNGNPYRSVTLDEEYQGKDRTNVFSNHILYDDLEVGFEITPDMLYINDKGYLELKDPDKGIKRAPRASDSMSSMMGRKEKGIEKSQDNKAESIKISSTARDATLMVTTFSASNMTDEDIKDYWSKWRMWLWDNFDTPLKHPSDRNDVPNLD